MKGKTAAPALLLVLLLLALLRAEADLCEFHSRTYGGRCYRSINCAAICESEQFTSGYCKGIITRQCICTKDCSAGGGAPGGGDDPPSSGGAPGGGDNPPSSGGAGGAPPSGGGGGAPAPPAADQFIVTARRSGGHA